MLALIYTQHVTDGLLLKTDTELRRRAKKESIRNVLSCAVWDLCGLGSIR
jgi:hypothetical protein